MGTMGIKPLTTFSLRITYKRKKERNVCVMANVGDGVR